VLVVQPLGVPSYVVQPELAVGSYIHIKTHKHTRARARVRSQANRHAHVHGCKDTHSAAWSSDDRHDASPHVVKTL
jgi:hypothetical protein